MAFMMPLVKQNYSLYSTPGTTSSHPQNGTTMAPHHGFHHQPRRRKNSDQTDRRTPAAGTKLVLRRNAKSEGTSLSSSPGYPDTLHPHHHPAHSSFSSNPSGTKPMEIRKARFSMPSFLSPQPSSRFGSLKSRRQASSLPTESKSPPPSVKPTFSPSSRSSISSSSSAESSHGAENFQTRLMKRLRKTLGLGPKDSRRTCS